AGPEDALHRHRGRRASAAAGPLRHRPRGRGGGHDGAPADRGLDRVPPVPPVARRAARSGRPRRAVTRRAAGRTLLLGGGLAVLYILTARAGLQLATVGAPVTLVWPPSGLALAALLLGGLRLWPGLALGATLANASAGLTLLTAGGIGAGNTLE